MSTTVTRTRVFQSILPVSVEALLAFHRDPQALKKLTPPPLFVQIRADTRHSLSQGSLDFTLWLGPLPVRWHALHLPGPTPDSFSDQMLKGPLARWEHDHIFEAIPGGVRLEDRIRLAHKPGWTGLLTRIFFDGLALRLLFAYRHWRTRRELTVDQETRPDPRSHPAAVGPDRQGGV